MQDSKNLILVIYVGVGNIRTADIPDYVKKISEKLTPTTLEGEIIVVPTSTNDTRVECINPKFITNEKLIQEHEELMSDLNENLKHQLDQLKNYDDEVNKE